MVTLYAIPLNSAVRLPYFDRVRLSLLLPTRLGVGACRAALAAAAWRPAEVGVVGGHGHDGHVAHHPRPTGDLHQGCQMAKFHPFLGLHQGGGRGGAIQGKEGIKFAVYHSGAIVQKPRGPKTYDIKIWL